MILLRKFGPFSWRLWRPPFPRLPAATLLLAALTFALTGCGSPSDLATSLIQKGDPNGAKVGDEAVDFTLPTPGGKEISLHEFNGHPVVIYFWASWCGSCTFDLPDLAAVASREAAAGVVTLTVNVGEDPEFVERYVREKVGDDSSFLVAGDTTLTTFRQYRIISFPTTFFVGKDGVIRSMRVGRVSQDLLAEGIGKIQ